MYYNVSYLFSSLQIVASIDRVSPRPRIIALDPKAAEIPVQSVRWLQETSLKDTLEETLLGRLGWWDGGPVPGPLFVKPGDYLMCFNPFTLWLRPIS